MSLDDDEQDLRDAGIDPQSIGGDEESAPWCVGCKNNVEAGNEAKYLTDAAAEVRMKFQNQIGDLICDLCEREALQGVVQ